MTVITVLGTNFALGRRAAASTNYPAYLSLRNIKPFCDLILPNTFIGKTADFQNGSIINL